MTGTIVQLSLSPGGVPKYPVREAYLTPLGFEGDSQWHPEVHGRPRKAVLLLCREGLDELAAAGFPVFPGALGENLTVAGLDRRWLRPGQRYQAGGAVIELTQPRRPCPTLDVYGPGIQAAIYDARVKAGDASSPRWGLSGFYALVVQPGPVRTGDPVTLLEQTA